MPIPVTGAMPWQRTAEDSGGQPLPAAGKSCSALVAALRTWIGADCPPQAAAPPRWPMWNDGDDDDGAEETTAGMSGPQVTDAAKIRIWQAGTPE